MFNRISRLIKRWPNYARAFGPVGGTKLLLQLEKLDFKSTESPRHYRVPGYPHRIALRHARGDHSTFWQCLVREQYDTSIWPQHAQLIKAYEACVSKEQRVVIIDGGANVGLASIWFAKRFPLATIVAVEPDPGNFALLQENTSAYGQRIRCVQGAVWHRDGFVKIVNQNAGTASFQVVESRADDVHRIAAYSIDTLLGFAECNSALIIKLDIEGSQQFLFQENTEWLSRTSLVSLELDDWQLPWKQTSRSFFQATSRYDFDYLIGHESVFCFSHNLVAGRPIA